MKYLFLFISIVLFFPLTARADNTATADIESTAPADYWSHADDDLLDFTNEMSICAWVKFEGTTAGTIVYKGTGWGGGSDSYHLLSASNKPYFWIAHDGTLANATYCTADVSTLSTGSWFHICGLYKDNDCDIFINGSQVGDTRGQVGVGANVNTAGTFYIGKGDDYLDAQVDDVRLYETKISTSTIQSAYNCMANATSTDIRLEYRFENTPDDEVSGMDLTANNGVTYQSGSLPYTADCAGAPPASGGSVAGLPPLLFSDDISIITQAEYCAATSGTDMITRRTFKYFHLPVILVCLIVWGVAVAFNRIIIEFLIRQRKK